MTLPASGTISIAQVNVEVGAPAATTRDLNWVRSVTKDLKDLNDRVKTLEAE